MSTSSNTHRPRREKANLHPGRIILETQTKRRTPAQKKADDLRAQEAIDAQAAAIQQAHARVSEMETAMEVRQVTQEAEIYPPNLMLKVRTVEQFVVRLQTLII